MLAQFLERPNRFVFKVETKFGDVVKAYCPNTSRLIGLLEEGTDVWLTANADSERETSYTVRRIRDNDEWVGIHAAVANEIYENRLRELHDGISSFPWEREVRAGESWIDFHKSDQSGEHWVEVKSLSSRGERGWAFFSGTPSKRAGKHLGELANLANQGHKAECVFIVQRQDVSGVCVQELTHGSWTEALTRAANAGVEIRAFRCNVTKQTLTIDRSIPTRLDGLPSLEEEES